MIRLRLLFAMLFGWIAFAATAGALELRQTLWGFDGRVVPGRMTPVSMLMTNPGKTPFDGELVLRQTGGLGGQSGAPFVQPVYIAPQSERWVQFHVFADASQYNYDLSWGRGARDRAEIVAPATGPPARVLLSDPDDAFAAGGTFKAFPDQLFPTTVAATDGLDAVVLDYTPRWEPARREAFVDWLKRGGLVLVLPGRNGEFPFFTEQLAVLNIAGDSARVGAGTVLRASVTRREAGEKVFAERGFGAPTLRQNQNVAVYNLEQMLFDRLARLTRPDIPWWLINTLTVAYLLVVGPVHYRWGRKIDYRVSIAAFLATVALFGWLFSVIGRRGYGESQTVHSLAIARALGGARHDVTQWISAFATRGDIYTLTHEAPANLYAAVSMEAINGRILNGKDGRFIADIPLYSSRQFLHRAAMTGDDTSVTVEEWNSDGDVLKNLVLKTGPQFPKNVELFYVRYRDRFYELRREGERLLRTTRPPQPFSEFISREQLHNFSNIPGLAPASDPDATVASDASLRAALPLLNVRAMDGREYFQQEIAHPPQPGERLRLYIFARAPGSFRMHGEGFGRENGYVLYLQDVFKP